MLPFFDMVFASDKATFYTPYAKLGQVPEGAAILTLPHMLGNAVVSTVLGADCGLLSLPSLDSFMRAVCTPLLLLRCQIICVYWLVGCKS
jgi:hypothetical protein